MKADIVIENGLIRYIGENAEYASEPVIDADGLYAIPGIIDLHCHLREPGGEQKETIKTGTYSAAKGGITTVLAMPNTNPPMDDPMIYAKMHEIAKRDACIDVKFASTMTRDRKGRDPVDFVENSACGYIAFTDDGSGIADENLILELSRRAKNIDALLLEHPEYLPLSNNAPCSYGKLEEILEMQGQSAESESLDILKMGAIAGMVGARVHFTHISTHKSVEAVRMLKRLYPKRITADTTPHHFRLSEDDNLIPEPNKKMNPPLRPESDRIAIERALIFGSIDAIATDHAPHTQEEKNVGFIHSPFGVVGFETELSVTFTHFVKQNRNSMLDLVKLLCWNPARILRLEDRGVIENGKAGDITLFDPEAKWTVTPDALVSRSKNSAFLGKEFFGKVKYTIHRGKVVYAE